MAAVRVIAGKDGKQIREQLLRSLKVCEAKDIDIENAVTVETNAIKILVVTPRLVDTVIRKDAGILPHLCKDAKTVAVYYACNKPVETMFSEFCDGEVPEWSNVKSYAKEELPAMVAHVFASWSVPEEIALAHANRFVFHPDTVDTVVRTYLLLYKSCIK